MHDVCNEQSKKKKDLNKNNIASCLDLLQKCLPANVLFWDTPCSLFSSTTFLTIIISQLGICNTTYLFLP